MTFLSSTAPWGSPVADIIPVPPFASPDEHRRFLRLLQMHLALVDVGGPALPTLALMAALEPPRGSDDALGAWPGPLALHTSLNTWFPAPWTPTALAGALTEAGVTGPTRRLGDWFWSCDPSFAARRRSRTAWTIERSERGTVTKQDIGGDRDLVVCWMDHYRHRFTFPVAYVHDEADVAALAPASLAVLQADVVDAEYPYRTNWVAERVAALSAAAGTAGSSATSGS